MSMEQEMKEALDGWFFTICLHRQETIARRVPKDHIPAHKPRWLVEEYEQTSAARQWTPAEDAKLMKMFEQGYTFKEMAKAIGVSGSAANNRFRLLSAKKGVEVTRRHHAKRYDEKLDQEVAHLHINENMTLFEIAAELNLTRNQVCGIWTRWRRKNNVQAAA